MAIMRIKGIPDLRAKITIYRDGVYAGEGYCDRDGEIVCSAVLGPDQDASDDTYEAIMDAIDHGDEAASRPDGEYSWTIEYLVP